MAQTPDAPPASTAHTDKRGKGKPRLTYAQRALVLAAKRDCPEATIAQIAQASNVSPRQVCRILANGDTRDLRQFTQDLLSTALTERLDDWAEASRIAATKGYHQPAQSWLEASKAIDPPKGNSLSIAPTITVALAFALPGIPTIPAPIDISLSEPQSPQNPPQITAPPPDITARATVPQAQSDLRPPNKPLAGEGQ